ncbi:transmembrane protein 44 isoform X2 [Channa argus]|uniref:transmembrane protein 44 isoform X2 n=1 Tax=Channa argus TaxID=215402 RepID=UPI00351FAF59
MNLQKLYFYWLIPTMYTAWLITGELLPKLYKSLLCVARVTQKLARQFSWPHTAGAWTRLFSASFNLNIFKVNMGTHILIEDGQTGQRPNNFLSNLLDFCVDSATTCLSPAADKLCVPIGLCALSALLLLLSCFLLVHQRYKFRTENPGETTLFLYCFLGDMCSTVGAILSRQLHIQILMGAFAAAMNAVQFMSCCFQVLLCRNSKSGKRWRMMRKRRRQHLLAVSILMVVGGGFLKSGVTHYYYTPTVDRPVNGRKVLHVSLQKRGQLLSWAYILSGLLCSLAGVLYAAAILLYDTQIQFLLRVMPWLLSAISCVSLDLLILVIHWCKRGARQHPLRFSTDTEVLVGDSDIPTKETALKKKHTKQQMHSSAQTKNMTEMGPYMDVNTHPLRKICLKEVTLSKEEAVEQLPDRTVRVVRVDSFCSSDTSCYSSPVSSDLEWDFEEAHTQWNELAAKQRHEFLLHEWPKTLKSFNTYVVSGLPQKALSGTEESVLVPAATLEN